MKLIALCGAPGAGKTAVQQYLAEHYGARSVDDGHPLRDFAMRHLGLTEWHVTTQEGKASMVWLPGGKTMQVREALGELGNRLEDLFGPDAIPEMALTSTRKDAEEDAYYNGRTNTYVFGSVRRQQGRVYKKAGATVVEVTRPGHVCVNNFDQYSREFVDLTLNNNGTVEQLHVLIEYHLGPLLRSN